MSKLNNCIHKPLHRQILLKLMEFGRKEQNYHGEHMVMKICDRVPKSLKAYNLPYWERALKDLVAVKAIELKPDPLITLSKIKLHPSKDVRFVTYFRNADGYRSFNPKK